MVEPLHAAATGSGGDRTPYGTGMTGGKVRSRGGRGISGAAVNVDAVRRGPYERPTVGRHASAGPQAAARITGFQGAWIGAGVASKLLNGATSLLSSLFRRNGSHTLALPAPPVAEEAVHVALPDSISVPPTNAVLGRRDMVMENGDIDRELDLEGLLKAGTFSKVQCDRYIHLLQSKIQQPKEDNRPILYPEDELEREIARGNRERSNQRIREEVPMENPDSVGCGGCGSSPVDIAKAFMDKRLSPMLTSALPVRTLQWETPLEITERPTTSRITLPTPASVRTPYARPQQRADIIDESARRTPYQRPASASRDKLKRSSSMIDDDFGPSRRIRRKANGPPLSSLVIGRSDTGNTSYYGRMRNLHKTRLDRTNKSESGIPVPVPMQSTETARKILQTLEIMTPPKGKSLEEELAFVRERPVKELSATMLNEKARKSMQDVQCPAGISAEACREPIQKPETTLKQTIADTEKGKAVICAATPETEFAAGTSGSKFPGRQGFRMNARLEESNSDDEFRPLTTEVPVRKTNASSATNTDIVSISETKPSASSPPSLFTIPKKQSNFTFSTAANMAEPPTPKPMPSPPAQPFGFLTTVSNHVSSTEKSAPQQSSPKETKASSLSFGLTTAPAPVIISTQATAVSVVSFTASAMHMETAATKSTDAASPQQSQPTQSSIFTATSNGVSDNKSLENGALPATVPSGTNALFPFASKPFSSSTETHAVFDEGRFESQMERVSKRRSSMGGSDSEPPTCTVSTPTTVSLFDNTAAPPANNNLNNAVVSSNGTVTTSLPGIGFGASNSSVFGIFGSSNSNSSAMLGSSSSSSSSLSLVKTDDVAAATTSGTCTTSTTVAAAPATSAADGLFPPRKSAGAAANGVPYLFSKASGDSQPSSSPPSFGLFGAPFGATSATGSAFGSGFTAPATATTAPAATSTESATSSGFSTLNSGTGLGATGGAFNTGSNSNSSTGFPFNSSSPSPSPSPFAFTTTPSGPSFSFQAPGSNPPLPQPVAAAVASSSSPAPTPSPFSFGPTPPSSNPGGFVFGSSSGGNINNNNNNSLGFGSKNPFSSPPPPIFGAPTPAANSNANNANGGDIMSEHNMVDDSMAEDPSSQQQQQQQQQQQHTVVPFGTSVGPTSPSPSSSPFVFGQPSVVAPSPSPLFGQPSSTPTPSLFGGASAAPLFGTSVVQQQQQPPVFGGVTGTVAGGVAGNPFGAVASNPFGAGAFSLGTGGGGGGGGGGAGSGGGDNKANRKYVKAKRRGK